MAITTPATALHRHRHSKHFPQLPLDETKALAADIKSHGQREPIVLFEGKILDGWNRYRACLRIKRDPDFRQFEGDDVAAIAFVASKNIHRRHLKAKQKRDAIDALLEQMPEKSDREIGRMIKADNKTVASVRAKKEAREEIPHISVRTDSKGRKQPAEKKKISGVKAEKVQLGNVVTGSNAPEPELSAKNMKAKIAALDDDGPAKPAAPSGPTTTTDPVAADEELTLLREFARFVIGRWEKVTFNPKDNREWKDLRERVKQALEIES